MKKRSIHPLKLLSLWILGICFSFSLAQAQEIAAGEYFWDADPGFGFGTPISVLDGAFDEACETAFANPATLPSTGLHSFHIRLQDTAATWGPTFSIVIEIEDSLIPTPPEITQAEYFWDIDPGAGLGTSLLAFDGNFDEVLEIATQNIATLPSSGLHSFNIRMQDNGGTWGPAFSVIISVEDSVAPDFPNLVQGEYFWDIDPGAGAGASLLALDGNFDDALETAYENLTTFPGNGLHTFNIRLRDDDMNWGGVFSVVVTLEDAPTPDFPNLVLAEYFWDIDPGQGAGNPLVALDGSFNEAIEIALGNITAFPGSGIHTFHIRFLDDDVNWGPTFTVVITLEDAPVPDFPNITQGEGYWDIDPGQGNGLPFVALDGNFEEGLETVLNATIQTFSLSLGPHAFHTRLLDDDGNWGPSFGVVVWIDTSLVPVVQMINGRTAFCESENLNGIAYTTPNEPGVTYTWTIAGGTIASGQGTANATVNWSGPGTHTLSVQGCDTAGCGNIFDLTVIVDPNPVATISPAAPLTLCSGDTDTLIAQNVSTLGVQWMRDGTLLTGETDSILVVSLAGNYQVILTGAGSCADTSAGVTVSVLPGLIADAGPDVFQCSPGDTVLVGGMPAASGGSGAYSYTWSPAAGLTQTNIARPGAFSPGTYTLNVIDGNGCAGSDQVTVTVNPLTMINPGQDTVICEGQSVLLGGFPTVMGGAGGFTYAWSPALGLNDSTLANPTASPSVTTSYTLTATDLNGCASTAAVVINLNPVININAGADGAICLGDSIRLGGSPTATGGMGSLSFAWTPTLGVSAANVANPMAAPVSNTDYTVTVTDANSCSAQDTISVTVNSVVATAAGGTTICEGSSTSLSASGGTNYIWSPAPGLNNTMIANPVASPIVTTTYQVMVSNGICTDTASVTVFVDPLVNAIVNNDTAACLGGSVQLSAAGGTSYLWSPATGLNSTTVANPFASPTTQTRYTVTVTAGACSDTASTLVDANVVVAQLSNDTTVCLGNSATLLARGGDFYAWTPTTTLSSPSVDNPTATPSVNTTYFVTVSDLIGCTDTGSVTVFIDPGISVTASGDTTICTGGNAQLQASGGGSYSWFPTLGLNNATIANPIATPTSQTTYWVVVSAGACTDSASVTVTIDSVDAVAGGGAAICAGGSVNLNASGGSGYSWSPVTGLNNPNSANPIASPGVTTLYTVTVSNGSCTDTASTLVTVNSATAVVSGDTTICAGGTANLLASGGTTFAWTPGGSLSNPASANPVASPAVTTTYTVMVTDLQGCTDTASVTVFVDPAVMAQVTGDTTICVGNSVALSASGGSQYSWSPATGLSNPNIANPIATPTSQTTYTVTVTAGACNDQASVTVSLDSVEAVAGGGAVICAGGSVNLSASGGTGYSWSPVLGLNNPNIANPIASPATTTRYTVTVSNGSCTDTASTLVTVTSPTAVVSGDTTICVGGSASLIASGGIAYAWTPGATLSNPLSANTVASPVATTTYTVMVTDLLGCTDMASVTVFVNPAIVAQVSGDTTICVGNSVPLSASGGSQYSWSPAAGLSNPGIANPIATPTTQTTYTVTVSIGACNDQAVVTVSLDSVSAIVTGGSTICEGGSAILNASGGPDVSWSPGTGLSNPNIANPIASPTVTTTYLATVSNGLGCSDTASATVVIDPLPTALFSFSTNQATATFTNTSLNGSTYSWDFDDGDMSTDVNPMHTYQLPGVYTVCLIASNACGNDTVCLDVNVNFVGVEPVWSGVPPAVFPNPNTGSFTLRVPGLTGEHPVNIQMQNALGVKVWKHTAKVAGTFEQVLTPDELSSGVYFLEVQVDTALWRRKVVIER